MVQDACVQRVSTRRVDDLVQSLGLTGMSKSQVSALCADVEAEVERSRTRPLAGAVYPYVWLDATFVKERVQGQVVGQAVVIVIGLNAATGQREVLGPDVGPSEDGAFWLGFLRGLVARGLGGVQVVVSDAHEGLKTAIGSVVYGVTWRRSRPSSPSRKRRWLMRSDARSPRASAHAFPSSLTYLARRKATCWPIWRTWPSRVSTDARSGATTHSSASTARSNGAPMCSASFSTRRRSSV